MENNFNIDDKDFSVSITISYKDEDGKFAFNSTPSKLEEFKERAKQDIDLVKAEHILYGRGFRKGEDGKWNIDSKRGGSATFKVPKFFYKDGDLIIKFGRVSTNLDFTLGSLSTLKSLPDEIVPFKDGSRKIYMTYDLKFVEYDSLSTHTFKSPESKEYYDRSISLPLFKANEDKVNRWFNDEFENLSIKNFNMDFLNWYIDKYPERKIRFYKYFEQSFNVLIVKDARKQILNYKAPKGFKDWIAEKKGERFTNLMDSIKAESKFKL